MEKHQLWVHYWLNPIQPKPKPEPVRSDETTIVLSYAQWIKNRCKCCSRGGASGLYEAVFTNTTKHIMLCAACGFREAYARWNGFFSPKLIRLRLMYTLTYPNRTETDDTAQRSEEGQEVVQPNGSEAK